MIYLWIVSFLWAFSFGLIKKYLVGIDPFFLAFMRLISALVVFIFFYKKFSLIKNIKLMFIGAIQFGCMYFFYLRSYSFLKAHEVAVLTVTTPIFIVFIHAIFERKLKFVHFAAAVLSVIASGIMVYKSTEVELAIRGVLYVQLSNFFFSFGQILYKRYFPYSKNESLSEFVWLIAGALIFISIILIHQIFIENNYINLSDLKMSQWLVMIYLGSVATGIGFYLWNKGAKLVTEAQLAVINNAKVPFAVLVTWLVFGESIQLILFISAMVIFAIALRLVKSK